MAYSAISQSELNPDSPIVDSVFSRMRDNWVAIKDGESGAPRIQPAAINPPTYGANWAWEFFGYANTAAGSWAEVVASVLGQSYCYPELSAMQVWRSGAYNFWISIERSSTTNPASVAVYRNGARLSAIYTCPAGIAYRSFVFGLSLSAGDKISVMSESQGLSTVGVLAGMIDKPFSYIG